jgi:hypothetical protein
MRNPSIKARLNRVEQQLGKRSIFSAECICFPEGTQPQLFWPIEVLIASKVKCPLHGERFKPFPLIYSSQWLREKREEFLLSQVSDQYRKAWQASFPLDLWPAVRARVDGRMVLILKDGTHLYEDNYIQEEPRV